MIISKELLSEVLGYEVVGYTEQLWGENDPCLLINFLDGNGNEEAGSWLLNIHELAHKCKEWAFDEGYDIAETYKESYLTDIGNCKVVSSILNPNDLTSLERTFKLCQWILENR